MSDYNLSVPIKGIYFGAVQNRWEGKPPSAIQKDWVDGVQEITPLGFLGDAQADLEVHGGLDKAIHHYAADHYVAWQTEGHMPKGTLPAAFGENISTLGMTEEDTCIGDIFSMGTAEVQISQGRQPCWKLGSHTQNTKMPYLFQKLGRTGWYYRVLKVGHVASGDMITLLERPEPEWTVKRVTNARLTRRVSAEDATKLAELSVLAEGWRAAFAKMADGQKSEDTTARLNG
ncbi:MOSC domain-containing protein [Amylibacter sp. SFDW26]|uniref:MOSC domain-containing protein n=1 Tax=Amylibacter sp. SFDW26 TaxID=2652722 RepID=UPI001261D88E|nr:MOSC domain-containing protein [Amylibacter sp. SFDW26]KAB7615405.1 MOSC domain-containing protein [Amylibacter sp. SFDW26]